MISKWEKLGAIVLISIGIFPALVQFATGEASILNTAVIILLFIALYFLVFRLNPRQ